MVPRQQPIKLFISHSSQDSELASHLVDTIKAHFDIPDKCIRCTSLVGYQLPGGANIAATLQTDIKSAKAVIGILTPNSITSPWVLCELGAVWGLVSNFIPVLAGLPPNSITGPLGVAHVWQLERIDDVRSSLNELRRYLDDEAPSRERSQVVENRVLEQLVSFAAKYKPDTDSIPAAELYSLRLGKKIRTSGKVFQDFHVSREHGSNVNAVNFLWADSFTNGTIRASIITAPDEHFLRIWFENGVRTKEQGERAKGWASNVEIRPQEYALGNENEQGDLKYKILRFSARIPQEEVTANVLGEVGLSVRILDRRRTYWEYRTSSRGNTPTQFRVTNTWEQFEVQLLPENFNVFQGDGNRWYMKYDSNGDPFPDFTVMAGIVVVLGRYTAGREEPQEGRGVIDIKNIDLSD